MPPANTQKRNLLSARRRSGHRTPCSLHRLARDNGDEAGQRGAVSLLLRTGCCESDPLARQPPVELDAASQYAKKEPAVGAAPVGPSHALLAPSSRAR